MSVTELRKTPLHALHVAQRAKMVAFGGYQMPVSYPAGILSEHRHCRRRAALFDVSHMGQLRVSADSFDAAARALETLLPCDVLGLAPGQQRYSFFTSSSGGILDDLMVTRHGDALLLVVNASTKEADLRHVVTHIGHRARVRHLDDRALLALQGPQAVDVLVRMNPSVGALRFMTGGEFSLDAPDGGAGIDCFVTRSGYTGEDGFEISVDSAHAEALARQLLDQPEVSPAGLGARDTLRLEAGLCLYGHDIDPSTTPVEAGLAWAIQKVRRSGGARAGGYPGADVLANQLAHGTSSRRVGLAGLERIPVREGAALLDAHGHRLGRVTSGTIGPTVDVPIAMGYLPANHALPQNEVYADVRGRRWPMRVRPMPFTPHRYFRG